MRHKCVRCRQLTYNWQKINGGEYHCYDGCYSTTGFDYRTEDGTPLRLKSKKETYARKYLAL